MSRVFCNKTQILEFVDEINKSQTDIKIKIWLSSNLKNFLLKKYKGVKVVDIENVIINENDNNVKTLKAAVENKETIYDLNISQKLKNEIFHIIDFLLSNKAPKSFVRLDYISARKHAKKWVDDLNKANKDIEADVSDLNIVHDFKNGYKLIQLQTEEEFKEEGRKMNHCVSSYWDRQSDTNLILSVRNEINIPIATIEIKLKKALGTNKYSCVVTQFKGKSNVGMIDPSIARELSEHFKNKYVSLSWYDSSAFGPQIKLKNSDEYDYLALVPENSVYEGNLNLNNSETRMLPKKFRIMGNLDLTNCPISLLGHGLVVDGDVTIYNSQVVVIDETVKIKGKVRGARHSLLVSYPDSVSIVS